MCFVFIAFFHHALFCSFLNVSFSLVFEYGIVLFSLSFLFVFFFQSFKWSELFCGSYRISWKTLFYIPNNLHCHVGIMASFSSVQIGVVFCNTSFEKRNQQKRTPSGWSSKLFYF